jgi:hypothetical protein
MRGRTRWRLRVLIARFAADERGHFVHELFGGEQPRPIQVEPPPTRDSAADAIAAREAEEKKRRAWQQGSSSSQLTSTGGVDNELTGTRMLTSGQ